MKRGFIRLASLLLVLFLIGAMFVGCSSNKKDDAKPSGGSDSEPAQTDNKESNEGDSEPEAVYPIPGNKKLTYWVPLATNTSPNYANFADTPFYQEVFKRTGVTVEFMHPPEGQAPEQFNLLLASGDLPDIIEYNWYSFPGGPEKAINDGHIISLNEVLEKYAPNLSAYLSAHPDVDKMVKTDNGNYYVFPFIRGDESLMVFFGPIVRKDWLDDLGMEVPVTIDDWYNVLKAFKEQKGADSPLTYEEWMLNMGAFSGAYGVKRDFYIEDGKIVYGPIQPGWKDFLETYRMWYKEGLLDKDIATVDRKTVSAKMTGGQAGASLGYAASRLGHWMQSMADKDPKYELVGAPWPVLNKGETPKFGQKDLPYSPTGSAAITTQCKDVELAARFLDWAYGEEGHMVFNFGIEGVSYNMVDGYPKYSDKVFNDPEGVPLNQAMGRYARSNSNGPFIQDKRYFEQYVPLQQQKDAVQTWMKTDEAKHQIPRITPTPEESEELANIMNEINTYMQEMFLKFLFGDESLDNFDQYIETIKSMGIERAIEIRQAALERYYKR